MDQDSLVAYLDARLWESVFDAGVLSQGQKLVGARLIGSVDAELLDTGDAEIVGRVASKDGADFTATIAFWEEDGSVQIDADCDCDVGANCLHAAGTLSYVCKATETRLQGALGENPHVEKVVGEKVLQLDDSPSAEPPTETAELSEPRSGDIVAELDSRASPTFLFRLQRRPESDGLSWLPEIYGEAYALYSGASKVALDPAGNLGMITANDQSSNIRRNRVAEMGALQALYALDLKPGAEQPPNSLRKVEQPARDGTLWQVDTNEWPDPDLFWQRFRHEAVPALERRGWEVRFAPNVGMKPMVFHTETWRAEIVDEGAGWFHLSAGFEIDGESFELQPILASLVANNFLSATEGMSSGQEFMIFLPDGRGLALPVGRFRRILTVLGQLMEFPFAGGPIRMNKLEAALLAASSEDGEDGLGSDSDGDSGLGIDLASDCHEIEALAERIGSFDKIERVPVPPGLEATLRDYQLDGYHWMQFLARYGLNGILADDMGLGKTLQTLTHILAENTSGRSGGLPSLVMAPTSVVFGWQREAEKFAPELKVLVLQGPDRHRRFAEIPNADIVMTSYALLARDLEAFASHEFHLFALDEAQHIKNRGAQVSDAVRQVRSTHRLCLSGTPVENSLGDLWSLMDFLMPGLLGSSDQFVSTYRTPIEKSGDREKAEALARRVGPLILRRTKHDVAKELPPKTEILHTIEMQGNQADLYETVRSTMDKQVRQALAIRGTEAQIVFLDALLKLRQICCHPSLLKSFDQGDGAEYPDPDQQGQPVLASPPRAGGDGAKFEFCTDLLATLRAEGHRVLVFSQFTSMLDILEAHLEEVRSPYLMLTGATKDRQDLVERWQGGEGEVFLISLKAGGTGLTLTGADTVIHYDPWWNPAAENQATDRAYRIGQDKPVFVHKLICQGTVEERIQQMQAKKDGLANDLLGGAMQKLSLDAETMAGLLE